MRRSLLALVLLAGAVLAAGLWLQRGTDDPFADYCAAVAEHREDIGAALGAGPTTGLLRALPSFEALAEESPEDIAGDWRLVIERITALEEALDAAGVDASAYSFDDPPADVPAADRKAIETAAVRLGSPETSTALSHVDQQARDVCKTPLSM
ncbi:hypothetical protein FHP29_11615 [Nocardioides albidus]|uniref:Uncharacterized protein n=1 Tax=Nocardioides albidus TaxID=1517589 RepID=A0A5C4VW92_9ACTN|nr:hypothetical protein [Nocardioides albidus]TNM39529.1 hypothetical protein FHP29_11615 [Nocardioides albidus]